MTYINTIKKTYIMIVTHSQRNKQTNMNYNKIKQELRNRIDYYEDSKLMSNRYYIHRAIKLINKINSYEQTKFNQ